MGPSLPPNDMKASVSIFFSCPGDMARLRQKARVVVSEIRAFTDHVGVSVSSWDYERNATAGEGENINRDVLEKQAPRDYDIYVGFMCNRFGQPTGNELSGTVDEFEKARFRRRETGDPEIFFYFCSNIQPSDNEQIQKVLEFRDSFPGLYKEFRTEEQFERLLKDDILLWFFQRQLAPEVNPKPEYELSLVAGLAKHLDEKARESQCLLNGSSERATCILDKLHRLFNLGRLSQEEAEALLLGLHVRLLAQLTSPDEALADFGDYVEAARWSPDAVQVVGYLVRHEDENPPLAGNLCAPLVKRILEFGLLLDRDQNSLLRSVTAENLLQTGGETGDWLRFLMREIRVSSQGVIQCVIEVPPGDGWAETLRNCVPLALQGYWQKHRNVFLNSGMNCDFLDCEFVLSMNLQLPPDLLPELRAHAAEIQAGHFKSPDHYGETPDVSGEAPPHPLESLLPLPNAAKATKLAVRPNDSEMAHTLEIYRPEDLAEPAASFAFKPGEPVDAEIGHLDSGLYHWRLFETSPRLLDRAGSFRKLGSQAADLLENADQLQVPEQMLLFRALDMRDEVFRDIWQKLPEASPEQLAIAFGYVKDGYDFLKANYGSLGYDDYWTVLDWLENALKNPQPSS